MADGSVFGVHLTLQAASSNNAVKVDIILSGSDCDPVLGLDVVSRDNVVQVATGARDGFVRNYWMSV